MVVAQGCGEGGTWLWCRGVNMVVAQGSDMVLMSGGASLWYGFTYFTMLSLTCST